MSSSRRAGFTLAEMLVAMTLTLIVFAITLPFVRAQSLALGANAGRVDAEQIARYAQRAIDRDLRVAVADPGQPLLVYAGPMGIAFNANLLAADTTDPGALEIETGAATTLTEAWRVADAAAIPMTAVTYPDADYTDAEGGLSRIETISYFLLPDTISDRTDIYVLYRRVNARDSVALVRGIHVPEDSAFFSYLRMESGSLTAIASASLPLFWDTTAMAEIRAVGLRSAGFFRNRQSGEDVIRTVTWMTSLPNASTPSAACTDVPVVPVDVGFSIVKQTAARPFRLTFNWRASVDDASPSTEVTHYSIERRVSAGSVWTGIASVPATWANTYTWTHDLPIANATYEYALRVYACGGVSSAQKPWPAVALP